MIAYRRVWLPLLLLLTLILVFNATSMAQGPADVGAASSDAEASPDAAAFPPPAGPFPDSPSTSKAAADDAWRIKMSIYGWFPGIHGTVGAAGHDVSIHESFSDVFHVLKGVIPIAVEANKGRFLMPIDFFWVKLGDDRGLPLNDFGQTSLNLHITESIFTPKFGYRVLDGEHLKIDALAGIRYWYVSQNLKLEPSGLNNTRSSNWVDGLGGMRFIVPLSPKAAIMASGDAGAGGASLDYQAVGLFTYDFTPKLGLGLGWRYLDVDYSKNFGIRGDQEFIYDVAQSGALAGLYFNFGGKPPVPPTASCSVSPTEIWAGDPVTATINTQNFNPKHKITYSWTSQGAKVSGTGTTATVETTGLAPGSYGVTGTATDTKEKKNNAATCSASFTVKQPHPPVASCSASPETVPAGESSTVSVSANSPDNFPLTYAWSSSGGSVSGSGTSATLNTNGAAPGSSVTATATVTDSRGLSTTCNATVNIQQLPPPVTVSEATEIGECKFMDPKRPWRVDNTCKATLDDVALRLQQEPNGKLVVVGYTAQEETVKYQHLGAQRAVNVKYYLTEGEGGQRIDPARIEPRTGTVNDKSVKLYFVPSGATFKTDDTTAVDESVVKGHARNAPAPKKKAKSPHTQTSPSQ